MACFIGNPDMVFLSLHFQQTRTTERGARQVHLTFAAGPARSHLAVRRQCPEMDAVKGRRAFVEDGKEGECVTVVVLDMGDPDVLQAGIRQGA
jgi:hypothetical protein